MRVEATPVTPGQSLPLADWLDRAAFAALCVLALLFPWERSHRVIAFPGVIDVTTVEILVLAALGLWVASWVACKRRPRVPRGLAPPLALWLAVILTAALAAPLHRSEALKFTARTTMGVLVGWAAFDMVGGNAPSPRRWRRLVQCLALAGVMAATVALVEALQVNAVTMWLASFRGGPTRVGDLLRVSSMLGYATIAALVLEMTFPLLLAWALTTERRWVRGVLLTAAAGQLLALALTLTRAAVLGLMAGLAMLAVGAWRQGRREAATGTVMAGGVLLLWLVLLLAAAPTAALRLRSENEQKWYQATYQAPVRLSAGGGEVLHADVTLTNASVRTWKALGPKRFALSYHLLRGDGALMAFEGLRTDLPGDVPAGAAIRLQGVVAAPRAPGEYLLVWDMVQEGTTWFSWKGAPTAITRLSVAPAQPGTQASASPPPPSAAPVRLPTPGRLALWRAALLMVRERPVLGVGPDNFRLLYGPYMGLKDWARGIHSNNLYIEWLVGTGLAGLAAFLWFNARLVLACYRGQWAWQRRDADMAFWHLAVLAALVTWFVHGLFDSFYEFTPTFVLFWIVAGLGASAPSDGSAVTAGEGRQEN